MHDTDIKRIIDKVTAQVKSEKALLSCDSITLALAKRIAARIEEKAKDMGVNAVVSICSSGARPVLCECMDDSYIASYDVAFNKAFTSVSLKMSTIKLKSLSQPHGPLYGIQHTNEGKIVIFGGGEPLILGDKIIGGLGVSGGSEEQDTALAAFGASCVEEEASKCL
ncbi:MAG: heme-binding protein [Ruminococcaceae bacterium]|nr:heme-binding protein [Oscillospiraceae bacterium]